MPLHQERPCHFSTVTCHLEHAPFRFSRNSTCHRSSASDVLATRKPYTHIHALHPSYATRPHTHTHTHTLARVHARAEYAPEIHVPALFLSHSRSLFFPYTGILPARPCSSRSLFISSENPASSPLHYCFARTTTNACRAIPLLHPFFSSFFLFFRFTFSALRGCISCVECTGRPSA